MSEIKTIKAEQDMRNETNEILDSLSGTASNDELSIDFRVKRIVDDVFYIVSNYDAVIKVNTLQYLTATLDNLKHYLDTAIKTKLSIATMKPKPKKAKSKK